MYLLFEKKVDLPWAPTYRAFLTVTKKNRLKINYTYLAFQTHYNVNMRNL